MSTPKTIKIDNVEYVRKDSISALKPNGKRAIVVINNGWIYAGDITEKNGRILLTRAVWVFRWEDIGFAKMVENPKSSKVDLRPMSVPVDIPAASEIYRCPVSDDWGL
tara:strand:+ start:118 stop:441 length:324 start_codon:yes stop_codon:yes gene_type:complete